MSTPFRMTIVPEENIGAAPRPDQLLSTNWTAREYLASIAMLGLLAGDPTLTPAAASLAAFQHADEMISKSNGT